MLVWLQQVIQSIGQNIRWQLQQDKTVFNLPTASPSIWEFKSSASLKAQCAERILPLDFLISTVNGGLDTICKTQISL